MRDCRRHAQFITIHRPPAYSCDIILAATCDVHVHEHMYEYDTVRVPAPIASIDTGYIYTRGSECECYWNTGCAEERQKLIKIDISEELPFVMSGGASYTPSTALQLVEEKLYFSVRVWPEG